MSDEARPSPGSTAQREHRVRAGTHRVDHVFWSGCATAGDHRNLDRRAYRSEELRVVAGACAIPIEAGQKDFSGATPATFTGPGDCVERLRPGAGARPHDPTPVRAPARIDCENDTLGPELARQFLEEIGIGDRGTT